jgi:hypothetical protein
MRNGIVDEEVSENKSSRQRTPSNAQVSKFAGIEYLSWRGDFCLENTHNS